MDDSADVGVVGAGISGLGVTHYLRDAGVDVVTFEADAEPGGIVKSREVDGHVLDLGPQRLRLTPTVESVVDEFELRDSLVVREEDQPTYMYLDGRFRVAPLSAREAVTTDLLSWRGKARVLLEPFTEPAKSGESVEAFLTRKFGEEAATRFMGPLYSGLYGTDPADMYVEYSLGKALDKAGISGSILTTVAKKVLEGYDTPAICSFDRGLQELPNAIYDRYADRVHLETPVTAIAETDDGYRIETDDGDVDVDTVVLTTPAGVAGDLLESVDGETADRLRSFNYNPLAIVALYAEYDRPGHGCHVLDDGFETLGVTWNSSMLWRDGVFTAYLGGSQNPALVEESDETIGEIAADEFETMTGVEARPLYVHRWQPGMPAYDKSWAVLDELDLPDGVEVCASFAERAGVIGRLRDAKSTADSIANRYDSRR